MSVLPQLSPRFHSVDTLVDFKSIITSLGGPLCGERAIGEKILVLSDLYFPFEAMGLYSLMCLPSQAMLHVVAWLWSVLVE
jgi:hypothetical protein